MQRWCARWSCWPTTRSDPEHDCNRNVPPARRQHRLDPAVFQLPAAGHADQRRQGADRPAEADDRGGDPVRRDPHRQRPRGAGLQLQQARGRPRPVRARGGDCAGADRRGPERYRAAVGQAVLGGRFGWPQRPVDAGHRRLRRGAVGPQGPARRPVAGQAAGRASRCGALLQHLGWLPAYAAGPADGQCRRLGRARHRRHQAESGPARRRARYQARGRGARAPGRRGADHGRRQPAMGPPDRAAHVPHL
ncbi:hypothetical protein D9M70_352860 [compost metagenome]